MLSIIFPFIAFCQQDTVKANSVYHQQDIKDWLAQKGWIKEKPAKDKFLLIIPIIASNPAAGFVFGGGLSYAYKSSPTDKRLSSATANASYSSKKLLNLNVKSNVFAFNERMVLNGDWRYMVNVETTYGLGTKKFGNSTGDVDINGYETSIDSLGQSLRYNQIRIHETASWTLFPNFFAGLGFNFDYHYTIKDQTLANGDTAGSYHYEYSIRHGFNALHYTTSGFSLNLLFDSRDNQVNAYTGYYANVNYRINLTGLGSTQNSTMLLTEFRSFYSLDALQRNILAFWFYGNFVTSGEVPYLLLPSLGYDQRQKTGRGYTFGRFRGENMVYGESEYRFPISPRSGILGGVVFLNLTSTSDLYNHIKTLEYIRAGYGGGLRIMLDKTSRTRLEVDIGVGEHKVGFYLGASETF